MSFKVRPAITLYTKLFIDIDSGVKIILLDRRRSCDALAQHEFTDDPGLYIFALRKQGRGGSAVPWYVGKTERRSLAIEALQKDKLRKYAMALGSSPGKPVLYFLTPRGTADRNRIDKLETFLIWLARQKNPRLLNKKKVHLSPETLQQHLSGLQVAGVLNSGKGKPGDAANAFLSMIGWTRMMHVASNGL